MQKTPPPTTVQPMVLLEGCGVVLYLGTPGSEKFLLLRNRKHGTWGFPKGHIEKNEMPIETALREVQEETGIKNFELNESFRQTISYNVTEKGQNYEKQVTYFLGKVKDKSLKLSQEHDRFLWADADEGEHILQHENLRGVLRAALQHLRESNLKNR